MSEYVPDYEKSNIAALKINPSGLKKLADDGR
jgi:hypothetical protein